MGNFDNKHSFELSDDEDLFGDNDRNSLDQFQTTPSQSRTQSRNFGANPNSSLNNIRQTSGYRRNSYQAVSGFGLQPSFDQRYSTPPPATPISSLPSQPYTGYNKFNHNSSSSDVMEEDGLPKKLFTGSLASLSGTNTYSHSSYEPIVEPHAKSVAFKDLTAHHPKYPPNIYSPGKKQPMEYMNGSSVNIETYEMGRMDTYDVDSPMIGGGSSVPLRPFSRLVSFNGDDYMINQLEDADDSDDFDPFGDDDSLFSETGEEIVRRGNTIKRSGTLARNKSLSRTKTKSSADYLNNDNEHFMEDDEDNFTPKLNYTKTIKKAKLVNGNYVIDAPVPQALLDTYGKKSTDNREMSYMRYTAVTCGPSNFKAFDYNIRQALYSPPRRTELLVCITMYNEDEILLARTLKGVFNNIKNLTDRTDPTWGEDSWKKVVILIVNDGRAELHPRSEKLLSALGVFQEGYAKSKINEKPVKAHLYEYTSTVGIDTINDKIHLCGNSVPVQLMFCLKEKNTRKINSHRWCFQSFCPILNPKVVMLLDCGTKPSKDAFYYLWRTFNDPNVAGACGEMRASLGDNRKLLANPLVAAQNFEYKISNILDKPMESVFGFISVLPGAFSAYRYEALLNIDGQGPLEKYFKGEFLREDNMLDEHDDERALKERNFRESGIFTSNMYLAEDRILCFELVAKRGFNYVLRYCNEAKAETDVPERIDEFVLQRRRWLNGSLFAAAYAVAHWTKIWRSNHSLIRKLVLQIEFYYQLVTLVVSWFSIASFFLVFRVLTANLGANDLHFTAGAYLAVVFLWIYVGSVVCTFVLAFGNTPRGTRKFYLVIVVLFAILMLYMMFAAIFLAVHTVQDILKSHDGHFAPIMIFTDRKFRDLVVSLASTYTLYLVGSILYGQPSLMFTSFAQYLALSPSYVNILNIYSFCNIHDVSWGTKGAVQAKDLGSAKSTGKKDELMMIVPGVEEELNEKYLSTLDSLRTVPPDPVEPVNNKKKRDDSYYALVRTITVLVWMLSNAILIAIVLEAGGITTLVGKKKNDALTGNSDIFLSIILWTVAVLAAFRFCGSVLFLTFKLFRPLKWRMKKRKAVASVDNFHDQ